jgi:hypothetical protein
MPRGHEAGKIQELQWLAESLRIATGSWVGFVFGRGFAFYFRTEGL